MVSILFTGNQHGTVAYLTFGTLYYQYFQIHN